MATRHRFLLLIHVLYCAAIIHGALLDISDDEICNMLCKECNASAVFVNNQCECNFDDDDNEGVECIQRLQRDIQTNLNNDLTNEERSLRSALKPRRRLRIGDAEKVAQYFMKGGASAGHSHFTKGSDVVCDNTNSATSSVSDTVHQSDTKDKFHPSLPISPLFGSTSSKPYDFPLQVLPGAAPHPDTPGIKTYSSILGMRPTFSYPVDRLYPPGPVLDSIVFPHRKHGRKPPPHVLLQMSTLPSHNLVAHHYFSYYPPMHHNSIGKNPYPRPDNSPTIPFVGQPYENTNDSNHQVSNKSSATENNADESVQSNAASVPAAGTNALYPPMQHRHFTPPYQYIPYHIPSPNTLYSPLDEYIAQAVLHYFQRASNSTLTSAQNPNSNRTNNANVGRQNEVQTAVTDKTVYSNDEQAEKIDDTTGHYTNVSKEQKET